MIVNKKQFVDFLFVLFLFGFTIFPNVTFATSINFTSELKEIRQGDIFVVDVKISSTEESINVVDGSFSFDKDKLEVKELSTGNSVFNIWAERPSFNNDTGTISFIGGIPDGFQTEKGLILKAIFLAKEKGVSELTFKENFLVFLNDGKGTNTNPEMTSLTITVVEAVQGKPAINEWTEFIDGDATPPEFAEAFISRDKYILDGKYFISFFATDKGSGLDYYETKEGDKDFVRSESPYVLEDQTLNSGVQIKAVDKAGNETVVIPTTSLSSKLTFYEKYKIWILWIVLGFISVFILRRLIYTKSI